MRHLSLPLSNLVPTQRLFSFRDALPTRGIPLYCTAFSGFIFRQQHPPLHPFPPFTPPISFIPTLTVPPPPFPAAPAPGPRTPLLRSFKSYLPRSTFSYIRSATSKKAFSTFCPLLAEVSTYSITSFFLHHASASSTVTALLFAASNPFVSPFATPEITVLDEAKSLLLPTSMTYTFRSEYGFFETRDSDHNTIWGAS